MPGRGAATHGPRVTPPVTKTKRKRHHSFTPEIPWFIYCTQAQGEMRFLQPTGELVIVNQQRIFFPGCKKSSIPESHNRRRTVSLEAWPFESTDHRDRLLLEQSPSLHFGNRN